MLLDEKKCYHPCPYSSTGTLNPTISLSINQETMLKLYFGLSRAISESGTMTAAGTPQWSAPEVIRHERYSVKADGSFLSLPPFAPLPPSSLLPQRSPLFHLVYSFGI